MAINKLSRSLLNSGSARSAFQIVEVEAATAEYRSAKTKLHLKKNDKVTVQDSKGNREEMKVQYVIGDAIIASPSSFNLGRFLFNIFKSLLI